MMVKPVLTDKQKHFRQEVSKLNSKANKRLKRLAQSDFSSSPAYQKWVKEGGEYFSIRGKTQSEVWKEYYRVQDFLESKTSSITGTKKVLKNMGEYTKLDISDPQKMMEVAPDFFSLYSKVSEYIKTSGMRGVYDSNQTFEQISNALEVTGLDLEDYDSNGLLEYITGIVDSEYYANQNINFNLNWQDLD